MSHTDGPRDEPDLAIAEMLPPDPEDGLSTELLSKYSSALERAVRDRNWHAAAQILDDLLLAVERQAEYDESEHRCGCGCPRSGC